MNFDLTSDQKMLQDTVRKFAEKELKPIAAEIDKSQEFPWKSVKKMAELGFMGVIIPEAYGGSGFDFVSLAITIEEISRVCATTGVITAVNNSLAAYPIVTFGNEAQRKKFLPPLASGETVGAFALTEPNAGSDPASLETTIRFDGDSCILNGTKRFITNAGAAGIHIVFATKDRTLRHKGIIALIVEKGSPGFSVGKHEETMGLRATANTELVFEDCRVPKANILGDEGAGFKVAMQTIDVSRIDIGAQAVGLAQGALDEAIRYSKERKQFGKAICEFEFIQGMLAESAAQIQAARLLVYYSAYLKDKGIERFSFQSAMSKLFSSTVANDVVRKAVQIHGGYGYSREYAVERMYRDAKVLEIYEGTSEIQKLVIARELLK